MSKALLLLPLLALAAACTPPKAAMPSTPAKPAPQPFTPTLTIRPTSVSLIPGATQVFQAEINYPEGIRPLRQPIHWAVIEPDGGSITAAGVYTAPPRYGTFHVEARREDFPNLRVAATVTVH